MSKQTVNYKKLANEIIDIIGDNNIESVTHCETVFKIYLVLKESFLDQDNTKLLLELA